MAFNPTDQFLLHRAGKDYRTTYSAFLNSLNLDLDFGDLDDSEVEIIVNNILEGKNPDGTDNPNGVVYKPNDGTLTINDSAGNPVATFSANQAGDEEFDLPAGFSGDYDDLTNQPVIGDGNITITASNGITLSGNTSHNVNQTGDTDTTIAIKTGDGIDVDSNGNIIIDTTWFSGQVHDSNIEFVDLDNSINITGINPVTTNQSSGTKTNLKVNTKPDGGLLVDSSVDPTAPGGLYVDTTWLNTNVTGANDVNIGLSNTDYSITISGSTPTTNQSVASSNTFAVNRKANGGLLVDTGGLYIDPSYKPVMEINDLTDVNAAAVDQYILTYSTANNGWIASYNPVADTPIEFQSTIDVEGDTAPLDRGTDLSGNTLPLRPGDLWIQAHSSAAPREANTSWVGIVGQMVQEGQYVMYGSDDLWHLGRTNDSLENVQSDWNQGDANQLSYILNKPDIGSIVDAKIGNGILNINNSDGTAFKTFTANQVGDTSFNLPAEFSGDYDDLTNKPTIGNGILNINKSDGAAFKTFTANQVGDTSFNLPAEFSKKYDDLIGAPTVGKGTVTLTQTLTGTDYTDSFQLDGNYVSPVKTITLPALYNTAITIGAGNGIDKTGTDATTNQSITNTTSLAVKAAASGGIAVDSDGVKLDSSFDFDSLVTAPGNGSFTINNPKGVEVLKFSANEAVDKASPVVMFAQNNYIQHLDDLP